MHSKKNNIRLQMSIPYSRHFNLNAIVAIYACSKCVKLQREMRACKQTSCNTCHKRVEKRTCITNTNKQRTPTRQLQVAPPLLQTTPIQINFMLNNFRSHRLLLFDFPFEFYRYFLLHSTSTL